MPPSGEVDLGPRDIVLDGDPAPTTVKGTHTPNGKGHSSPHFLAHVYLIVVKRSPISATAELLLLFVFHAYFTIQCVRFTCC